MSINKNLKLIFNTHIFGFRKMMSRENSHYKISIVVGIEVCYIQVFIFSLSRVFHVATASLRVIRSHVRASVDRNTLQWLVNLYSGDFVAMLRREWLACGRDSGEKRRENKHSNTLQ